MDIGCTLADGFFDHVLDQHYDGRAVDVLLRGNIFHHIQLFLFGVGSQCLGYFFLTEIFIDRQHDAAGGGYYGLYLEVGDDIDVIDGVVIQGIRHGDHENVEVIFFVSEGEDLVLLQDVDRHQIQHFLVHIDALEIDHIQIQLFAQCLRQVILRYDAFIYEEFSQLLTLTGGIVQRLLQLFIRENTAVYQQFT